MHIVSIGFFASDYLISLANALAQTSQVTLFASRLNLEARFPDAVNLEKTLRDKNMLAPEVSLKLIEQPTGRYLEKLLMLPDLFRSINELNPDIVHFQSGGDPWVPLTFPWLRKFPLIATIHDASRHLGDGPSNLSSTLTNLIVTGLAHQIIVHGQQQADILLSTYRISPQKINVIPFGSYEMYTMLSNHQIKPDDRTVLFFGRLRPYKGLEVLLRAAPLIAACVPDVRIVIAGSGSCDFLKSAAAEHPNWYEIHNRFIAAAEVHEFFERATIVVQPYLEASQSGVIPLAYGFGKPVVATRVGSIPEIVEDGKTGLLVQPGDENALAEAVVRLLRNAALRDGMSRAAKEKQKDDLSWDAIAARTMQVYERAQAIKNVPQRPEKTRW